MLNITKFLSLLIFYKCVFINCHSDETVDELVTTTSQDSSPISSNISIDVTWKHGDLEFDYKKQKIGSDNWHCYTSGQNKRIASVYHGNSLVWVSDGEYPESVCAYMPSCGDKIVLFKFSSSTSDKRFVKQFGYYYESGTIALDIGKKSGDVGYTFEQKGDSKNGERVYNVKDGEKITLVVEKKTCGKNTLFWKPTGSWYSTQVVVTTASGEVSKISFKLTNGNTKTDLVLVKQDKDTWVPENSVYLNTENKDKAPNCKYSSTVQNKNGTFTYKPVEGFSITRVSNGDNQLCNLVWQSSGSEYCSEVTGTVNNGNTVKYELSLMDENGNAFKRVFDKHDKNWVESSSSS